MAVRIATTPYTSNVIPLRRAEVVEEASLVDEPLPEPAMLYGLTVLAFLLHTPTKFVRRCVRCGTAWPCDHLKLAYRLREGF
jgi:hypothetical protein